MKHIHRFADVMTPVFMTACGLAMLAAIFIAASGVQKSDAQSYNNNTAAANVGTTTVYCNSNGTTAGPCFSSTKPGIVSIVGGLAVTLPANASVTANPPVTTSVDCSLTLTTSGTAYQLVPNYPRRGLIIQNVSSGNVGLSFTSTAPVIGNPGTYTLVAGAFFPVPSGVATSNAIFAVGSAASQAVSCTIVN